MSEAEGCRGSPPGTSRQDLLLQASLSALARSPKVIEALERSRLINQADSSLASCHPGAMAEGPDLDTYLIAVKQEHESTRVYALMASSPAEALEIVAAQAADGVAVEVAGKLSKRMARSYKLKPGDLILI